jgi:predicted metal-dependent hydrolase
LDATLDAGRFAVQRFSARQGGANLTASGAIGLGATPNLADAVLEVSAPTASALPAMLLEALPLPAGLAALPASARERFEAEAHGFIGQEATHRRIHQLFNEHLSRQGLVNHWEPRILRRVKLLERLAHDEPRNLLAATAAIEHLTALMSQYLLSHPAVLEGAEPRLQNLWLWHACEESEHRCTAFDLYRALGGNETWRVRLFRLVSLHFAIDLLRQTLHNLWRDGTWRNATTWSSGWRTLFGPQGVVRTQWRGWRRYAAPDFHPSEADGLKAQRWLAEHAALAPPVRG